MNVKNANGRLMLDLVVTFHYSYRCSVLFCLLATLCEIP